MKDKKIPKVSKIQNKIIQRKLQMGMIKTYLNKYLKKDTYLQKKKKKLFKTLRLI